MTLTGVVTTARLGDGSPAAQSVTTAGDGTRYIDIATSTSTTGKWSLGVSCTGPIATAAEANFEVSASTVL